MASLKNSTSSADPFGRRKFSLAVLKDEGRRMGILLVGLATYVLLINWTCKRLEQVSNGLRKPV